MRALPPPPPTRYTFDGFFAPLANAPVVNEVKAGKGVNVRFSLDLVFRFDDGQERVARFRLGR